MRWYKRCIKEPGSYLFELDLHDISVVHLLNAEAVVDAFLQSSLARHGVQHADVRHCANEGLELDLATPIGVLLIGDLGDQVEPDQSSVQERVRWDLRDGRVGRRRRESVLDIERRREALGDEPDIEARSAGEDAVGVGGVSRAVGELGRQEQEEGGVGPGVVAALGTRVHADESGHVQRGDANGHGHELPAHGLGDEGIRLGGGCPRLRSCGVGAATRDEGVEFPPVSGHDQVAPEEVMDDELGGRRDVEDEGGGGVGSRVGELVAPVRSGLGLLELGEVKVPGLRLGGRGNLASCMGARVFWVFLGGWGCKGVLVQGVWNSRLSATGG
jgi:hypothetical protein